MHADTDQGSFCRAVCGVCAAGSDSEVVPVKIRFRQSGGFAGQIEGCDLDTEQLSAAEGRELKRLVKQSGIRASFQRRTPQARDALVYELEIERDGAKIQARFDEPAVQPEQGPLLEFLLERARAQPIDKK